MDTIWRCSTPRRVSKFAGWSRRNFVMTSVLPMF
jgi:hypothetical protein